MKPYRPSNGTEGAQFESDFCQKCAKETWKPETDKGVKCPILDKAYLHDVGSADYPVEWIYQDDKPACTAFEIPAPYKKPEPNIPGQISF